MPTTAHSRFRGKESCTVRLYIALTSAPYGRGKSASFGAMTRNTNLNKNGRLSFSQGAFVQAFKSLEDRGIIRYTHQKAGRSGTANRVYEVLQDLDADLLPPGAMRGQANHTNTNTPSDETVEDTATDPGTLYSAAVELTRTEALEVRVRDLEDRFDAALKALATAASV